MQKACNVTLRGTLARNLSNTVYEPRFSPILTPSCLSKKLIHFNQSNHDITQTPATRQSPLLPEARLFIHNLAWTRWSSGSIRKCRAQNRATLRTSRARSLWRYYTAIIRALFFAFAFKKTRQLTAKLDPAIALCGSGRLIYRAKMPSTRGFTTFIHRDAFNPSEIAVDPGDTRWIFL